MKTRFDGNQWIGAFGVVLELRDMGTDHLLNTVKMLVQKPARTQAMLISDIENGTFAEDVWTPLKKEDSRKKSINNVTSMTADQLIDYAVSTPLFKAMLEELEARGVNTDNILALYTQDEAFFR